MRKILLNKNKSKNSVNNENSIPIIFNRDISLFHDEVMNENINILEVYNNEKDESTKHRFIFTLYPICTNLLFNKITEVIYKEGSNYCVNLTNNKIEPPKEAISTEYVNRIQAIRNTEYSESNLGFTYHCGVDIFNNHLLRLKDSSSIQPRNKVTYTSIYNNSSGDIYKIDSFNTIGDYIRQSNGENIEGILPDSNSNYIYKLNSTKKKMPLYLNDTILSFNESYNNNIKRKDGWVGFNNKSTINIPHKINIFVPTPGVIGSGTQKEIERNINKCINNKETCQFIDLTPERDLFYFTPKKNNERNRLEYNWDYFLTYPYKSIYKTNFVNGDRQKELLLGKNQGLPLIKFSERNIYMTYIGQNGINLSIFRSAVKHNLKKGDIVNIKFNNNKNINCIVINTGTLEGKFKDRYFTVKTEDFIDYVDNSNYPERFSKIVNGFECEYYFRILKKLGKVKNNEILPYRSNINRLAFANTIYGDEVSQIVYTDDIDIFDYIDNQGRPLTEIYLTILKSNRGNDLWYEKNNYNDEKIEFSHIFGKVSSGLNLPNYVDLSLPVIGYQHNISEDKLNIIELNKSSQKIEDNITKNNDEFYGDLIEFNPTTLTETVIEEIYHRFNTAQRETSNDIYNTIYYDEIGSDIYDLNNENSDDTNIIQYKLNEGYANLGPEGYIYKPHYKIKIGMYEDNINQSSDIIMNISNISFISNDKKQISFETKDNYLLIPNDLISFVNEENEVFKYKVLEYKVNSITNTYTCKAISIGENMINEHTKDIISFKHNLAIPEYAYMLPDKTGRHLWKDIIKPSKYSNLDELYSIPFTNGAFYHHLNINFFIRRQDPFHKFGLFLKKDGKEIENNFEIPAIELDNSIDEYNIETKTEICF